MGNPEIVVSVNYLDSRRLSSLRHRQIAGIGSSHEAAQTVYLQSA